MIHWCRSCKRTRLVHNRPAFTAHTRSLLSSRLGTKVIYWVFYSVFIELCLLHSEWLQSIWTDAVRGKTAELHRGPNWGGFNRISKTSIAKSRIAFSDFECPVIWSVWVQATYFVVMALLAGSPKRQRPMQPRVELAAFPCWLTEPLPLWYLAIVVLPVRLTSVGVAVHCWVFRKLNSRTPVSGFIYFISCANSHVICLWMHLKSK